MTPTVDYDDKRLLIQNGDVLLYEGEGFLSWCIKTLSRSKYSHSGIAVWWNDRLMVMEAIRKGVVVTALSRNVSHYHGNVEWRTAIQEITPDRRLDLVRYAQKQLGNEYNFIEAIVIGIKIIIMKCLNRVLARFGKEMAITDRRVICSQFVAETYESIGIRIERKVAPPFITPEDIQQSDLFEFMGALKKQR
jgi:hypothetical protein